MQDIHEAEEEEEGPEYDEHVWTSPVNAQRICRRLCEELCRLDPEGESFYRANCEAYCQKLESWTTLSGGCGKRDRAAR